MGFEVRSQRINVVGSRRIIWNMRANVVLKNKEDEGDEGEELSVWNKIEEDEEFSEEDEMTALGF